MFLGLVSSLKDYFSNLGKASFIDLIPFIIGLFFGFILCLLIYFLIVITSFKKSQNIAKKEVVQIDNEIVKNLILNVKNNYLEEASSKKANEKVECLKTSCWDLINDIAKEYYPEAKHPLFELSIDELITLDYYIMKRIEKLFSGKVLSKFKKLKISTVMHYVDLKKKYDDNKLVKAANKAKLPNAVKTIWSAVNIVNPVYWVKKLMIDAPLNLVLNRIALLIIDVVGEETSNIYSKNALIKESDRAIDEQVKEIEKMLGE